MKTMKKQNSLELHESSYHYPNKIKKKFVAYANF